MAEVPCQIHDVDNGLVGWGECMRAADAAGIAAAATDGKRQRARANALLELSAPRRKEIQDR